MKQTILLEIDLEKDVPNLLAHIENRASTISGVRMVKGEVALEMPPNVVEFFRPVGLPWYRRLLGLQ